MNDYLKRSMLIIETIRNIKQSIANGATISALNNAKKHLLILAEQKHLFPESEFPWPTEKENNVMYCIYDGADKDLALYIDLLRQGVNNAPHNHGDSWAIVAGIHGQEIHHLYKRIDKSTGPGHALLEPAGEITIGAGESISLLQGGIHAITAADTAPVMMLHCYSRVFEHQEARLEFNLTNNTCAYGTGETGLIIDVPLHSEVQK